MTLIISGHLKDHNSIVLRVSDRAQTGIRRSHSVDPNRSCEHSGNHQQNIKIHHGIPSFY